jgi:signal transduction histidine kinase
MEYLELKLPRADEEIKNAIKKIEESTLRANDTVQNLLKFASPSELKTERQEPKTLITEALSLFKFRIPLSNIQIEADFSEDKIYIEADRSQMLQVMFNILMNAVEASGQGGRIKIKTYKTINEEFMPGKPACIIEVADTGEGIAKEDLSKLFEPFFTTKRERKGTGLGLFMSKLIVENHKGRLLVKSEPGKGTCVKIILPITAGGDTDEENHSN